MVSVEWPTIPVCLGLRNFPGHGTLTIKTRTVPGKPGQVVMLEARHIHSFLFCLTQSKSMIAKALCPEARQATGKVTGLRIRGSCFKS